jgi:drug/metabolite transporter (DMT)-like permease
LTLHAITSNAFELAYAGILSVGVAYTLQVVGQGHTHPAAAAIILSSEMLFAAIAGALVLGERLSSLQIIGATLILSAILVVELMPFVGRRWKMRRA